MRSIESYTTQPNRRNYIMATKKNQTQESVAVETVEPNLEQLMTELKTKSAVIRKLSADGWTNGKIAKYMEIRYPYVRNVLVTPLKKQPASE